MLDGTEARHLGSLSHDPVIDQEMMKEVHPCSLWERVLGSVAQRYLCADNLYMQQTQWKTIEQGIQRLKEMAVAEIVFSDDLNTRNPDLVPCTPVMWRKLVRLGPQEYSSALAIMKWDDMEDIVLEMAKKLRANADAVHSPTHTKIAALETRIQKFENRIEENHKKLREEMKEGFLQITAVQAALEKGEAPEHLQYIDDIIMWENTAIEVFEKGEKIIQILLEVGFTIKKSKVKGPAQKIQFLRVNGQDRRRQIPTEVINKITVMSSSTNKKETQAFLSTISF
ncbi:hypothetical protein DUI87_03403 [Hirundo rustica rustica]|uniref:Uncharacterized protein n=1 Tax=Hirundo rustica rustica TaxID=333673 RepID=A0A3M0L2Z1_HIRRU|nr:hypothetical protein DUI87_03403 [Hirundo rustica rustica]